MAVSADHQSSATTRPFQRQRVLNAHGADVIEVFDALLVRKVAHQLSLLSGLDVLVGREMVHDQGDFLAVDTQPSPALRNSLIATGAVMSLAKTRSSFAKISSPGRTESRWACAARIFCVIVIFMEKLLLICVLQFFQQVNGGHNPFKIYSMESTSASQLAWMMSVETPTVVQLRSPFVLSMSTRTLAAEPFSAVRTRTL